MAKQRDIWKFNDDEWKVHISDDKVCEELVNRFDLRLSNIYYENVGFNKETDWDVIVPNSKIDKVKKFIKDNT